MSPPSAHPATKMLCAQPPSDLSSGPEVPAAESAFTALSRARMKSCWSRQSNIHASEATVKTNQWFGVSVRYQGRAETEGDDIKGSAR